MKDHHIFSITHNDAISDDGTIKEIRTPLSQEIEAIIAETLNIDKKYIVTKKKVGYKSTSCDVTLHDDASHFTDGFSDETVAKINEKINVLMEKLQQRFEEKQLLPEEEAAQVIAFALRELANNNIEHAGVLLNKNIQEITGRFPHSTLSEDGTQLIIDLQPSFRSFAKEQQAELEKLGKIITAMSGQKEFSEEKHTAFMEALNSSVDSLSQTQEAKSAETEITLSDEQTQKLQRLLKNKITTLAQMQADLQGWAKYDVPLLTTRPSFPLSFDTLPVTLKIEDNKIILQSSLAIAQEQGTPTTQITEKPRKEDIIKAIDDTAANYAPPLNLTASGGRR